MRPLICIVACFIYSGIFCQSFPITPSIVTFINDSSALICDDTTQLRIDLDQDSSADIVIQRGNMLRVCTPMGGPAISHQEYSLSFLTVDSTVMLSRQNLDVYQAIAEEFMPGQRVDPNNYWPDNRGYFYFDWIRQISPSACTTFSDGSMSLVPNIHQFLARKTIGGVDYHFLFAMEYSSHNDCYQLVAPRVVGLSTNRVKKDQISASFAANRLQIEYLDGSTMSAHYQLYDLNGRLKMEFSANQARIDKSVSHLNDGIHLLRITNSSNGEFSTFKLLKQ